MFDHLRKLQYFSPFRGVAQLAARQFRVLEAASSSPATSTKNQPKTSHFWLVFGFFLYILHKFDDFRVTTCLPKFRTFDCCLLAIISFVSENSFSLSSATQFLKADGCFSSAFVRIILIDKLEFVKYFLPDTIQYILVFRLVQVEYEDCYHPTHIL